MITIAAKEKSENHYYIFRGNGQEVEVSIVGEDAIPVECLSDGLRYNYGKPKYKITEAEKEAVVDFHQKRIIS